MIVGWRQWADAGGISSELPQYLIEKTGAQKIGEIKPDGFYLFQIPGTHHFLRPEIKLKEGYRQDHKDHQQEHHNVRAGHSIRLAFHGYSP